MDIDIPFTALNVWVKQLDQSWFNETAFVTLKSVFPLFYSPEEFNSSPLAENQIIPGDSQERRFAGDQFLPRGRYFSIATDETGADSGTLAAELDAYYDPATVGPVEVADVDLLASGAAAEYERHGVAIPKHGQAIGVTFLPFCEGSHPLAHRLGVRVPEGEAFGVTLPVSIRQEHFDRAIDLRMPMVADWFASEFSAYTFNSHEVPISPFLLLPRLERFYEVLPTILCQQLGGNKFTRIAGRWLRDIGADALVFPSARFDTYVLARNSSVIQAAGWNLVDYRDAPRASSNLNIICDDTSWPATIIASSGGGYLSYQSALAYEHIRLGYVAEGVEAGSWALTGMREKRTEEICEGLKLFQENRSA